VVDLAYRGSAVQPRKLVALQNSTGLPLFHLGVSESRGDIIVAPGWSSVMLLRSRHVHQRTKCARIVLAELAHVPFDKEHRIV
jgi:hypothetical protein